MIQCKLAPVKLFFLDDARQNSPSRAGMGRLIGVGGVCVSGENVGQLERTLDSLCRQNYGFPPGEEFKWSPGRELWMRENLVGDRRFVFFRDVVQRLREAGA